MSSRVQSQADDWIGEEVDGTAKYELDKPVLMLMIIGMIVVVIVVLTSRCCERKLRSGWVTAATDDEASAMVDNDCPSAIRTRDRNELCNHSREEVFDPLALPPEYDDEALRLKHADFYRAGGRVVEAPDQKLVAATVAAGQRLNWSIGIHEGDFLVPVCHQGMNRSQVMRLALTAVVEELDGCLSRTPTPTRLSGGSEEETLWVSRAHGAVSGCDPHCAYGTDLDEENFFGYLFDEGLIFADDYDPYRDEDPQQGPLQRAFVETFGVNKLPRIGEELARPLQLNPASEYTTPQEFQAIGRDRQVR